MSPRDRRFSRTIGTKPFSGHRYVFNGQVRIEWVAGGKRHTRSLGENSPANRELADTVLAEALAEAKSGQQKPGDLTLAELLTRHREEAPHRRNKRTRAPLRAKTLTVYAEYERAILAGLPEHIALSASSLRKRDVYDWITAQRRAGLADGTIGRRVDYLKQVYRWAVAKMELLEADPIAGVEVPSRESDTAAYSPYEGRALLENLMGLPAARAWRFRALVIAEAMYGARANQILHLEWPDLDFDRKLNVTLPDGRSIQLEGAITFRSVVLGSKGQPDRTLPLLPVAREAFLEAWNHRRTDSPWVFWCHRNPKKPSPYGSMHHSLENLEELSGVDHMPYRAFHGFRRALATAIVEALGVSQAAKWIADSPAVIMRRYLKPTEEAKAEAAIYLVKQSIGDPKPQSNSNSGPLLVNGTELTATLKDTSGTGAAGLEPATCHDRPPVVTDAPSTFPHIDQGKVG